MTGEHPDPPGTGVNEGGAASTGGVAGEPGGDRSRTEVLEDLRLHKIELEVQLDELRRAEAQVAALGERYRRLFNEAPVPMLAVDELGRIVTANVAARELLAEGSMLSGRPLVLFVAPEDHTTIRQVLTRTDEDPVELDTTFRDRYGTTIPCQVSASRLRPVAGEHRTETVLTLIDRREAERMRSVLAEAERSVVIRQLTGGIAHDFNNLLTVISGHLTLIADEPVTEQTRSWLAAAGTAAERGATLVAQLLAYARAQTPEPVVCDVRQLIDQLTPLLRNVVGEAVTVQVVVGDDLPNIEVDPTHLQTSLLNLAINSRDARCDWLELRVRTDGDRDVVLEVADDGHGMPERIRSRATEPFFTTKSGGRSSGLGLAMVASFVSHSNGRLDIASTDGGGTTVRCTLPGTTRPAVDDHRDEPPDSDALGGRRVLLVEDQEAVRTVTAALLRSAGAEVESVHDSLTALTRIEESSVDVVLSDVVLGPGMDGVELARRLGRDHPELPVVLMSGYAGRIAPGHTLLRKPVTRTQLVRTLTAAIEGIQRS